MNNPTHADIVHKVESLEREIGREREDRGAFREDMREAQHETKEAFVLISKQMERIEERLAKYDQLQAVAKAVIAVISAGAVALWWAVHDRVEQFLGIKG